MKRHPKQAFGVFHDGLAVRMVQLTREGKEVFLQAVDQTELDRYWYKILDEEGLNAVDAKIGEEKIPAKNDIDIAEFDDEYVANYQLLPSEQMLAGFDLRHGVIALNVYDDNIFKDNPGAISRKEMDQFVKSKVPSKLLKNGDWQSAIVTVGGQKQHWLHSGTNRLFDMLLDYQKSNRLILFYQLGDANDIALTDYFKVAYADKLGKSTLLVYLGQEYRKAFVFNNGEWVDTLKLQITQSLPEPEIISSKLALAIDSAQIQEPEVIVFCGDLVNPDLIEHMKLQFPTEQVEPFSFGNLLVSAKDSKSLDIRKLTSFTIPIALAYKALFPDDERFTPSNFLPARIIEGQKEFKVAWHGFVVLFFVFAVTLLATNGILKANLTIRQERELKRDLDFTLGKRRNEAAEIQKIRTELDNQGKSIEILKGLLDNKNPWTEILSTADRVFASQSQSWLTNLKVENNQLFLSGVTSRRTGIIEFANAFPDSKIMKVVHSKIRGKSVWTFEMTSALPKVDWVGAIEHDVAELVRLKQNYGEDQQKEATAAEAKKASSKPVKPIAPQRSTTTKTADKQGRAILPVLPQSSCPIPRDELTQGDGQDVQDYFKFVTSVNKGNIWDYRDRGTRFIAGHPSSELLPAVRWWLSYRLYLDKELSLANQYLAPMLEASDRYLPYAMLLKARVDYANGNDRYEEYYRILKTDYGRHSLISQVNADLELIAKGAEK